MFNHIKGDQSIQSHIIDGIAETREKLDELEDLKEEIEGNLQAQFEGTINEAIGNLVARDRAIEEKGELLEVQIGALEGEEDAYEA